MRTLRTPSGTLGRVLRRLVEARWWPLGDGGPRSIDEASPWTLFALSGTRVSYPRRCVLLTGTSQGRPRLPLRLMVERVAEVWDPVIVVAAPGPRLPRPLLPHLDEELGALLGELEVETLVGAGGGSGSGRGSQPPLERALARWSPALVVAVESSAPQWAEVRGAIERCGIPLLAARTPEGTVLELLERLAGGPDGDGTVELALWLLDNSHLITPPRLSRLARRLAAEDLGDRVRRRIDAEPSGMGLLLLGLIEDARRARRKGGELSRHAIAAGLPSAFRPAAKETIAASRFHRLGGPDSRCDEGLVILEPGAATDLVPVALEHVRRVTVCGSTGFTAQEVEGLAGSADEQGVVALPFRLVDVPGIRAPTQAFADRLISLALQRFDLPPGTREVAGSMEGLPAACYVALHPISRWLWNVARALDEATTDRVFLVAHGGGLVLPLADQLLAAKRPREVWWAPGGPSAGQRRRLLARVTSPTGRRSTAAASALNGAPGKASPESLEGSPFLPLSPASEARHRGKPTCLLCAGTARSLPNAPLRELVARLLPRWQPVIVVLGGLRNRTAQLAAELEEELGPLLPEVTAVAFDGLVGSETAHRASEATATSHLLADPELARIELRGLRLAPLLDGASQRFLWRLNHSLRWLPAVEAAMEEWSPEVILTVQNYSLEWQLLRAAARSRGIPTVGIQVLLVARDSRLQAPDVDHFLTFDGWARDALHEEAGFPLERMTPIGSYRYDAVLARARRHDAEAERRALGVAPGEKLVVVATQPLALEESLALADLAMEALQGLPQARLVVKLHPAEELSRVPLLEGMARQRGMSDRTLVTRDHDIYRLLQAADLVVNIFSNVGLEAAILGKDVVAVELDRAAAGFSLDAIGLVEAARSREQAISQIRAMLFDPDFRARAQARRREYFERNPELTDGRSLERLGAILEQAARDRAPSGVVV